MKGTSFEELCEISPGQCMLHKRAIMDFRAFWNHKRKTSNLPAFFGVRPNNPFRATAEVVSWINENFLELKTVPRKFKQPQLYIHGPPNSGKSSLWMKLSERFRCYPAGQEDWFQDWSDDDYDFAVFDEFTNKHRPLQALNQFMDGSNSRLKQKGGSVIKMKNVPVIICSNFSPEDCYPEQHIRAAFEARIVVVKTRINEYVDFSFIEEVTEKDELQ